LNNISRIYIRTHIPSFVSVLKLCLTAFIRIDPRRYSSVHKIDEKVYLNLYVNIQNRRGLCFVKRYFVPGIGSVKDYRIVELEGLSLRSQKVVFRF